MLKRRDFIKLSGIVSSFALVFFYACKKSLSLPAEHILSGSQKELLVLIHNHLFPKGANSPGASDINSAEYVSRILKDPQVKSSEKRLILFGINWTRDTAKELFSKDFAALNKDQKEEVLLDLGTFKNGERWLSRQITFILEALLADPIYGGNTNQSGWSWLKHTPGYPRPDIKTKYQYL